MYPLELFKKSPHFLRFRSEPESWFVWSSRFARGRGRRWHLPFSASPPALGFRWSRHVFSVSWGVLRSRASGVGSPFSYPRRSSLLSSYHEDARRCTRSCGSRVGLGCVTSLRACALFQLLRRGAFQRCPRGGVILGPRCRHQ